MGITIKQQRDSTKRALKAIEHQRRWTTDMLGAEDDDKYVNGELLAAANSYIEAAMEQLKTRDQSVVQRRRQSIAEGVRRYGTGYSAPAPIGGLDTGYKTVKEPPQNWPLPRQAWRCPSPRVALVQAAALLIQEAERLERADSKAMGYTYKGQKKVQDKEAEPSGFVFNIPSVPLTAGTITITHIPGGSGGQQTNALVQQP